MIVERFAQGGADWHRARLGIPTASNFERIITPKTRKLSSQQTAYLYSLLAEWLIGVPSDADASPFMDRGTRLEPQARSWYAYEHGVDVETVGIVLRDDRMVGASPDGLVGADGLLEIKCPSAATHVRNLVEGMDGYYGQCQGALWLSGRSWVDLLSYHPDLPPAVLRYGRDEEFIQALDKAVSDFVVLLRQARAALIERGCQPATRLMLPLSAAEAEPF